MKMLDDESSNAEKACTDYKALVEVALARYKLACEEMDRLTAGNPGNTWRWSIPANPDRDTDLILSASAEDVPRLVAAVEALLAMEQRLTDHIVQLAAERDAAQRIIESHRCGENVELAYRRTLDAQDERDALRTQLDNMTVEWGVTWGGASDGKGSWNEACRDEEGARGVSAEYPNHRLIKRLVSPWTVVEGDDQ